MISIPTTTHLAVRKHGVCRGSLWRQEVEGSGSGGSSGSSVATTTTTLHHHHNKNNHNNKNMSHSNDTSRMKRGTPPPPPVAATSSSSSSSGSSSFWSSSEVEYCTVTSNWLICHESYAAYDRGDPPLHWYRIVGASSYWSATTQSNNSSNNSNNKTFQLVTNQGTQLLCQAVTPKCREHWLAALQAGLELTLLLDNKDDDNITTKSKSSAEGSNSSSTTNNLLDTNTILRPPPPQLSVLQQQQQQYPPPGRLLGVSKPPTWRYCSSCGALESSNNPLTAATACPVFQYGMEHRMELRYDCFVAQGLVMHLEFIKSCMASALQEHEALIQARAQCVAIVTPAAAPTPRQEASPKTSNAISSRGDISSTSNCNDAPSSNPQQLLLLPQEHRNDEAEEGKQQHSPPLSDEDFSNPQSPSSSAAEVAPAPAAGDDRDSDSSNESWTRINSPDQSSTLVVSSSTETIHRTKTEPDSTSSPSRGGGGAASLSSWIHISPTSKSTTALLKALRDKKRFGTFLCASPFLQTLTDDLFEGRVGVPDFLEQLDDAVGRGETETASLKKQAFRVAGDMGTAMKLLLDYALPPDSSSSSYNKLSQQYHRHAAAQQQAAHYSPATTQHATQMLQCLLEFFLDLCEDGELNSVAFFWPQLCHIHLCMLPPENALAVARVDLMEDFLLTVASEYSIHLALELVWSHKADLEESLASSASASSASSASLPGSPSSCCRARRFAVLRFVCELESYLFGQEHGWSGGSVTLGKMLSATNDQMQLVKQNIRQIQHYRQRTVFGRLDRSVRHRSHRQHHHHHHTTNNDAQSAAAAAQAALLLSSPEPMVHEKLRIAKNADYFSSHLNFTKRVCDIAEKLRFMEVKARADALQEELRLLNASGSMGGDPLNRISNSMIRIVRVPSTEGHVFRSKERTPVLLLVEQIDEKGDSWGNVLGVKDRWNKIVKESRQSESDDTKNEEAVTQLADLTPTPTTTTTGQEEEPKTDEMDEIPEETEQFDSSIQTNDFTGHEEVSGEANDATASAAHHYRRASTGSELEGTPQDHRQHTNALKRFNSLSPSSNRRTTSAVTSWSVSSMMPLEVMVDEIGTNADGKTEQGTSSPSKAGIKNPIDAPVTTPSSSPQCTAKMAAPRRMFKNSSCDNSDQELAPTGDIRREVLNVIMMIGRKERNSIAAGAAESVQRSLKELEIKRATALLLGESSDGAIDEGGGENNSGKEYQELASTREKLASLGLDRAGGKSFEFEELSGKQSEEDEVMEAVRLLLVQNRVAQGHLSPADAAKVLQHISLRRVNSPTSGGGDKGSMLSATQMPSIDAGDLDPRLAGCGPLPPAVLQALTLWKGEMLTNGELLEVVKKDIDFVRHSVLLEAETVDKLKEDSAFWGRFAFGERWAEKKARIAASSPHASHSGWDLVGIIVKSNDDLRQEAFVMQLIELCQEAFEIAGLELWVSPYRILATGRTTGIIEMVRNAMSFDALKKRPGYGRGGLREHLHRMTEFTADPGGSFKTAQQNFVRSLAAYSLMSYFFLFKDRHNGNLLLDTAGHVIHIDFGFVLGVAPGGSFSLEMSTPFKLTEEMLEVMGGLQSPLFSDFVTLFCCGFLALQSYSDTFLTLVEITSRHSTFKCFSEGSSSSSSSSSSGSGTVRDEVLTKLRERFRPELSKEETVAYALDLIQQAITSYGTKQYDLFQYLSQGIAS